VVVSVASPIDPTLVTGTGFAGGVMTYDEKNDLVEAQRAAAEQHVDETVDALGLTGAETMVVIGDAGHEICRLAEERCRRAWSCWAHTVAAASSGRSSDPRPITSCATVSAPCWCRAPADPAGR
jgi:hypothetical protein